MNTAESPSSSDSLSRPSGAAKNVYFRLSVVCLAANGDGSILNEARLDTHRPCSCVLGAGVDLSAHYSRLR